jgi:hypothetical protein
MRLGTKSVLYGAHAFWLHPFFLAYSWWQLYGFPWDPRLWVAFFVHDLGYLGKQKMDDEVGETHPIVGARIISWLFDRQPYAHEHKVWNYHPSEVHTLAYYRRLNDMLDNGWRITGWMGFSVELERPRYRWYDFVLLHSRFYAKKLGKQFSNLCVADKAAIYNTPWWVYLPLVNLTGEIHEYMANSAKNGNSEEAFVGKGNQRQWHQAMCTHVRKWVSAHKNGAVDTWTPVTR